MHQYVGILGGIVVDLANLDFPFRRLEYRIDNGCGGLTVRNLGDGKRLVVDFSILARMRTTPPRSPSL